MAEETLVENQNATGEETAETSGSSVFGKLKILLFVVGVVIVECVIAYLYLPNGTQGTALADGALEAGPESTADGNEEPDEAEAAEEIEVALGEFNVTAFQPVSNTTLRIDFELYATVDLEDEDEVLRQIEENKHRFREQVIVTLRSADISELTDPGLGLIKRKILERTNRMFGRSLLRGVVFSDFSFIPQ